MSKKNGKNSTVASFDHLTEDYYNETFKRFPVIGGGTGIKALQPELGRATPTVYQEQAALTRKTLDALQELPIHDFEGEDWLNRLTLRSSLIYELGSLEDRRTWQTNPQIHLEQVTEGIFSLLIRHADNLKPVAPAIVSRLKAIPKYLDEAVECIQKPVPLWTKLARDQAPGVRMLLVSLPGPLSKVTSHGGAALKKWAEAAAAAVDRYAGCIGRKKAGPQNGFSIGTERFEAMMRNRLGLHLTAREAKAAALSLAAKLQAEMKAEAKKFHPRKSADEILAEAAQEWEFEGQLEGKDLLSAYHSETVSIRNFFHESGVVTFPEGDDLLVKPVPEFMSNVIATAAYSSPGALERDQTGIFWVNDLSLKKTAEAEKRAEIEQHFGLELTTAHEAYPGHHLQFVQQHRHPNLARKLAHHAIYYEGWTLWCEQMTVDLNASKNPYLKLLQIHDALWRAWRIVIDCGLHTGELTYKQATEVLQREVGFTKARASVDVNWYTSSPTIPMSYLLGKMELLRLKRQRVDRGGWTLRQFNDWVLRFGAIPWSWIEASGL